MEIDINNSAILEKNAQSSSDTFFLRGTLTRLKLGAIIIITSTLFVHNTRNCTMGDNLQGFRRRESCQITGPTKSPSSTGPSTKYRRAAAFS